MSAKDTAKIIAPETTTSDFLAKIDVFQKLPPGARKALESSLKIAHFDKHESIFLEDDKAAAIWFVQQGYVKEVYYSAEGKIKVFSLVGPNGMFGVGAFTERDYGCHCIALTETTVIPVPLAVFQTLLGQYPEMAQAVLSHISGLLRDAKEMEAYSHEKVDIRILHLLLRLVGQFGNTIPLTRRDIGEMAGTTVETTIRVLSRFERSGLVSNVWGHVTVKDVQVLKAMVEKI